LIFSFLFHYFSLYIYMHTHIDLKINLIVIEWEQQLVDLKERWLSDKSLGLRDLLSLWSQVRTLWLLI